MSVESVCGVRRLADGDGVAAGWFRDAGAGRRTAATGMNAIAESRIRGLQGSFKRLLSSAWSGKLDRPASGRRLVRRQSQRAYLRAAWPEAPHRQPPVSKAGATTEVQIRSPP